MFRLVPVLSISLVFLAAGPVAAQTFQRTIGGVYDDRPHCIETTIDGGSIICGDQSIATYT